MRKLQCVNGVWTEYVFSLLCKRSNHRFI